MKVFMLANPVAVHTQKWVKSLSDRGINILLYLGLTRKRGFIKTWRMRRCVALPRKEMHGG